MFLRRPLAAVVAASALCLALAAPARAQMNTGESSVAGLDLFWSSLAGQVANPAGGSAAWVIDPLNQHPNWVAAPPNSRWVTASQGWEFDAPDNIWTTYFMSFTVADPSSFWMTGNISTDNNSVMLLNGAQVGTTSFTAFTSLAPFSLNGGFVSGTNTLAVQVFNGSGNGNPSGVLVADLQTNVVPEPATFLLLGTGLLGLGVAARRRRTDDAET